VRRQKSVRRWSLASKTHFAINSENDAGLKAHSGVKFGSRRFSPAQIAQFVCERLAVLAPA
jgi:hypothetical protein